MWCGIKKATATDHRLTGEAEVEALAHLGRAGAGEEGGHVVAAADHGLQAQLAARPEAVQVLQDAVQPPQANHHLGHLYWLIGWWACWLLCLLPASHD